MDELSGKSEHFHANGVIKRDIKIDADFWQQRYAAGELKWDMGQVSPPIKAYIDQLPASAKSLDIMVAGAGNAYEVGYLHELDFDRVTVFDIAAAPLNNFANSHPDFPKDHLVCADFFKLSSEQYQFDLAIEQTFFCAIEPQWRVEYVRQMHALLKANGKLVGVLFDREFSSMTPPFGGSEAEYRALFAPYFEIEVMQRCYNSHPARQGSELFVILRAKLLALD
ncbi:methyltransferase domain-containing protein [Psychrobacter pygoscelis]|uniref:methyltransferase domain-containing protein n=1 Tax=Psychrobacter pygoscelis TaxID=2488563 RepID=UPI001040343F|nr:methyltransferase domain-containing protein [Psychrobacter pygoscelis]